jgi:hypothetical protein
MVALRWRDVDLDRVTITFGRSIAGLVDGAVEKGTTAKPDQEAGDLVDRLPSGESSAAVAGGG